MHPMTLRMPLGLRGRVQCSVIVWIIPQLLVSSQFTLLHHSSPCPLADELTYDDNAERT